MTNWIIPCNPKYYDVTNAFNDLNTIDWKQSNNKVEVGDYVYIYVSRPIQAIKYKCIVRKVLMDHIEIDDSKYVINGDNYLCYKHHMKLELVRTFDNELTHDILVENGLAGKLMGPRRAKDQLNDLLASF